MKLQNTLRCESLYERTYFSLSACVTLRLSHSLTNTPPCMDLIVSVFVITALQEVAQSTWVPCSGIHSEWTL